MVAELIQSDPAVMMGKPVVAGTRITVESILEKLSAGETIQQVLEAHPRLTREGVLAALGCAARALRTGEPGDTIPADMGARRFLLLKADIDREMAQVGRLLEESRSDLKGVGGVPTRLEVRGWRAYCKTSTRGSSASSSASRWSWTGSCLGAPTGTTSS